MASEADEVALEMAKQMAEARAMMDAMKEEKEQLTVVEGYMPEQMSDEELEGVVKEAVQPDQTMQDMGQVMGSIMPKVKGQADGKRVSDMVKKVLSENAK